jgi:lisH domain-containing protein FOPNL
MDGTTSIYHTVVALMKEKGAFAKMSAEIRAEVYHLLTRDAEHDRSVPLCRENFLLNELIREYLQFKGLNQTLSVFVPETGQPREPMNRDFLGHSLNLARQQQIPLLNLLVQRNRRSDLPPRPSDPTPTPRPPLVPEPPAPDPGLAFSDESSDDGPGVFEIRS